MPLPTLDSQYISERGFLHQVSVENGMTCVVLPDWPLPHGYNRSSSNLLIRLQAGYPDVPPDMWWFEPFVQFADGSEIPATQVRELHLGRTWQRWSRHLRADQWRAGIDGLETYLALVSTDLQTHTKSRVQ